MTLNDYRDEAAQFPKAVGAGEEHVSKILGWLDEEVSLLKGSINDEQQLCHKIYDVLFLLFELAGHFELDLDSAWTAGRQRKQLKYLDAD